MKAKKITTVNVMSVLFGAMILILAGCSGSDKKAADSEEVLIEEPVVEEVVTVEDVWVIDEHQINDVPLTTKANTTKKLPAKKESAAVKKVQEAAKIDEKATAAAEDSYEVATSDVLNVMMTDVLYTPVVVTESVIPLDETQTLVAYSKSGDAKDMVQVISSGPDNEVEQVIFTSKKHRDVFNVQAGMSGKEVKELRKDLKHLRKEGKSYLYDDESNVMYLMQAEDMQGDVATDADIDNMSVQAIIWKDKKHHKK